jgi:hypothetical protein
MKSPITASHSCRQKKWVLLKERHLIRQNERLKFSQQQPIFTTNGRLNRIRHARLPLTHLACRIGTQFSDDLNVDRCRGIGSGTGRLITEIGTVGTRALFISEFGASRPVTAVAVTSSLLSIDLATGRLVVVDIVTRKNAAVSGHHSRPRTSACSSIVPPNRKDRRIRSLTLKASATALRSTASLFCGEDMLCNSADGRCYWSGRKGWWW